MPASRQATGADLPCAIETSIWRSSVTICSALNLFFGMTSSFPSYSLTTLGPKKPGQVNYNTRRYHESLDNLTPQNVYFGTGQAILEKRQRIKLKTIQQRRALHRQSKAA